MKKLKIWIILLVSLLAISTAAAMTMAEEKKENINRLDFIKGANSDDNQYAPDEIIVKFEAGTSDETISIINSKNLVISLEKLMKKNPNAVENEKTKILKKHGIDRIYLLKLQKNSDVSEMVSKYSENPDVEYAEPNYKVHVDATIPNDSYFSLLWGMHNTGQSGGTVDADIDAPEAWDTTKGNDTIVVAVIDSGVDYNHLDLNDNIWTNPHETPGDGIDNDHNGYVDDIRGWDFYNNDNNPYDDNGHGTHCSGTIAAEGNNGIGVAGVSWNTKIMPLKFLNRTGSGYTFGAISAVTYATQNGADIMSNSWGGGSYTQALENAISAANDAGILFVAAAGNAGSDNDALPHYPSSYNVDNIISVAATDRYDNLASFSNYGLISVDLGAPGVDILSTYPGGYAWGSGTSMATPHVAGAAALIKAHYPNISVADLKAKMLNSVDSIDALAGKTVTGGRLNVANCLDTTPDTEAPMITGATGNTTGTTGEVVTISATITDNVGVTSATVYYTPIDGTETAVAMAKDQDTSNVWKANVPVASDKVGTITYYLKAKDAALNETRDPSTGSYSIIVTDNDSPIANAGSYQSVVVNATVTLDGSGSSDNIGIVSYKWDFDASNGVNWEAPDATGMTVTTSYSVVGTHTVTLQISDAACLTATDTEIITVTETPVEITVFTDSFEISKWNGLWTQDIQNDWFRSTQRAINGSYSAEVDGRASNAKLTSIPIDLQGKTNATITFSWYIESGLDSGEYLAFDVSTDKGTTWVEKASLKGNSDDENVWHDEIIDLTGINSLRIQFRGTMSDSTEDANVDMVKVTAR
jgi:subtilisin family serine protease